MREDRRTLVEHLETLDATLQDGATPSSDAELRGLPPLELPGVGGGSAGAFVLEEALGQGGMGVVHAARQVLLDRRVAVKRPRRELDSPRARSILLREALVTGRLEHPNVCPVHLVGADVEGRPAIVMKLVEGVPWRRVIEDPSAYPEVLGGREPLEFHVDVLQQVCQAVHFAHCRGVLHRDIKPDNVMIGRFGEVYLLDWGLAAALDDGPAGIPRAADGTELVGTPDYLAPEMANRAEAGVYTDVYLLGATLHHALVRRPRHDAATIDERLDLARRSATCRYPAEIPGELGALANAACALDPTARPPSADAFRRSLLAWEAHRGASDLADRGRRQAAVVHATLAGEAPDPAAVSRLALSSRVALEQSLEAWPEHPSAGYLLSDLDRALAEFELARENPDGAESIVAGKPALADLLPRVAALRSALDARNNDARAMAEERRAADLRSGARWRGSVLAALGLAISVLTLTFAAVDEFTAFDVNYPDILGVAVGYLAFTAGVGAFGVLSGRLNRASMRQIGAFQANTVGFTLAAAMCWWSGAPIPLALALVLLSPTVTLTVMATYDGPAALPAAAMFLAGAGLVLAVPTHAVSIFAVSGALAFGAMVLGEVRRGR